MSLKHNDKKQKTAKDLADDIARLTSQAEKLAEQLNEEIVNRHSDWIVDKYGIDLYLKMQSMVSQ